MSDIEWADPPPVKTGPHGTRISDIVDQLKTRPGQWALVAKGKSPNSKATWVRHGCETVLRRTEPRSTLYDVYARWPREGDQ